MTSQEGELSAWVKQIRRNTGSAIKETAQSSSELEQEIRKSRLDRAKRRSRLSGDGVRGFNPPMPQADADADADAHAVEREGNAQSSEEKRQETLRRLMGQRSPPITSPTSERPPSPTRSQPSNPMASPQSNHHSDLASPVNQSSRGAALLSRYGGQSGPTGVANAPIGHNTSLASFMGGKASGPRLGKLTGDGRSAPPEAGLIDESRRGNPLPGMTANNSSSRPLASFLEARSLASGGGGDSSDRISPSKEVTSPVASGWGGGPTSTSSTSRNNNEMGPPSQISPSYQTSATSFYNSQKENDSRPRFSPTSSFSKGEDIQPSPQQSPRIEKASFTTLYRSDSYDKSKSDSASRYGSSSNTTKKDETDDFKPIARSFVTSPSPTAFDRKETSVPPSPYKSTTLPPPSNPASTPSKSASDSTPTRTYSPSTQNQLGSSPSNASPAFSSNSPPSSTDKLPTASLTRLSAQKMVGQRIREAQARASSNSNGSEASENVTRSSSSNSFTSPVKASYGVGASNNDSSSGLKSPTGGIRDRWPVGGMISSSTSNSTPSNSNTERKPWTPGRMGTALPGMTKSFSSREESDPKEVLATPVRSSTVPDSSFKQTQVEEDKYQSPVRLPGLGSAQLPNAFRNSTAQGHYGSENPSSSSFPRPSSPTKNVAAVPSSQDESSELAKQQKSMEHLVKGRARPPRKTGGTNPNKVETKIPDSMVSSARPQSPVRKESHQRSSSPTKELERPTSPFKQPSSYQRPPSPIKTSSFNSAGRVSPVKDFERALSPIKDYERPASPVKSWQRPPSPIKSVETPRPASPSKPERSWQTSVSREKEVDRPSSPIKVGSETPTRSLTNLEEHLNSLEGSEFRDHASRASRIVEDQPKVQANESRRSDDNVHSFRPNQDDKREIQIPVSSKKLPKINAESLIKNATSLPLSGSRADPARAQTISIEVLSISPNGSTTAIPANESNLLYSNELLIVIHRFKESSGLTSTKLYSRIGKDFKRELRGGRKAVEERKLKEISERYHSKISDSEPSELCQLLGGSLVRRDGIRKNWDASNTYMLKIRGVDDAGIEVDQVELASSNLDSLNCFIISLLGDLILWFGNGTTTYEQEQSLNYAKSLSGNVEEEISSIYHEGKEDEFFWTFFEDKHYLKSKSRDLLNFRSKLKPKQLIRNLYQIKSVDQLVKLDGSEIQLKSLYNDRIHLLETNLDIFLLIGEAARSERDLIQVGLDLAQHLRDQHFKTNVDQSSLFFKPNASVLIFPSRLPKSLTFIKGFENDNQDEFGLMNVLSLEKARTELSRSSWPVEVLKDVDHLPLGVGKDLVHHLL